MKRVMIVLLLALLIPHGYAQQWNPSRETGSCGEDRSACMTLQSVMLGSFDAFDSQDVLESREFYAALEVLCAVSEEEIEHLCREFAVEESDFYHV